MLAYVFNKTTPQNVSQPLLLVGEAVCGIWVGVYFFNEDRQFTSNEKVVSVIALFGVTLIAMSTFISN
jgi:hypothetical protein